MEKLTTKQRVALYNSIVEARKSFFEKLREHDLGEISLQEAQLQTLLPFTGEVSTDELKKQTSKIYKELKEYFDINNLRRQKAQMEAAFDVMEDMRLKLEFVKNVLQQVVDDENFDVLAASENALRASRMAIARARDTDDETSIASESDTELTDLQRQVAAARQRVAALSSDEEEEDLSGFAETKSAASPRKPEPAPAGEPGLPPIRPTLMRQRTEAGEINEEDLDKLKAPTILKITRTRYPVFEQQKQLTLLRNLGTKKQKVLLLSNVSNKDVIDYAQALMTGGVDIPRADTAGRKRVADQEKKLRQVAIEMFRIPGKRDIAISTLKEPALRKLIMAPITALDRDAVIQYIKELKQAQRDEEQEEGAAGVTKTTAIGKGIKRGRGRPRKKQGKGVKRKRGRPKKEDKHLVNSLVLHTGSKEAGNDNLDKDIRQIINRMHKNKMITGAQKKELLNKYI